MNIRSRFQKHKKNADTSPKYEDQFYDICDDDSDIIESHRVNRRLTTPSPNSDVKGKSPAITVHDGKRISMKVTHSAGGDVQVFEQQLTQLQEQLVAVMIENKSLNDQLEDQKESATTEQLQQEVQMLREKNKLLEETLKVKKSPARRHRNDRSRVSPTVQEVAVEAPASEEGISEAVEALPVESTDPIRGQSRLERLWENTVDRLYDLLEDFTEQPSTDSPPADGDPLAVKTLKENIKRFKLATKPYMDTVKGFHNLVTWKSPSYTFIVFCVYMYSVWKGWFLPVIFCLMLVRLVVSYLHFKNYKFKFSYLDPGTPKKESEDALGLSDKFNLVLEVATKVQNGLGSAADSLEKVKNLFSWRHPAGARRVLTMLCFSLACFVLLPTSYLWRFIGLSLGVKVFFVNYVYNRYPRIKQKYDSTHRLWQELPTDAGYEKTVIRAEMNRYIVVPSSSTEPETTIEGDSSSSDSDSDTDCQEFRQLFSLPPTESPVRGWLRGKRTVLFGKDRSLMTLLSKKRGKLYLTKSFLCFEREKIPSSRNIVIPLQDIVGLDKVKIHHRMPGRGMAIQIRVNTDGKEKVLVFGGIINRDEVTATIEAAARQTRSGSHVNTGLRPAATSRRSSSESSITRIQNFTFAAFYEDSE